MLPPVVGQYRATCLGCGLPTIELHRTRDGSMRCLDCFLAAVEARLGLPAPSRPVERRVVPLPMVAFRPRLGAPAWWWAATAER